jgi:trimethylamine--corrinoid protein Co-methyltransferase
MFRAEGQKVEGNNVKFDPDWILAQVAKAPKEFTLQARNPKNNVIIGGDNMVFGGVYGPPFVRDLGVRRDGTLDDFQNFTKLTYMFEDLDVSSAVVVEPNDAHLDTRHIDMTYSLQTLSDKAYMGNVVTGPNARDVIKMTEIVFGSRESIEKTPAIISLINCNSPLRWDDRMLDSLFEYSEAGQPCVLTPFLLMGAMSPVTIPASLVQQIAEALSGIALAQLVPSFPTLTCSQAHRCLVHLNLQWVCFAPARLLVTLDFHSVVVAHLMLHKLWTPKLGTNR